MKKFNVIYKEKLNEANELKEGIILRDFKKVYSALLEKYEISKIQELDKPTQNAFLSELATFWTEEVGITSKGVQFLKTKSTILTENSTTLQKKNYLKTKVKAVINESIQKSEVKWRIYDIIDEMYSSIKASGIQDILSPDIISTIIYETFVDSLNDFTDNIRFELSESNKPKTSKKYYLRIDEKAFSKTKREELAKEGKAMSDGSFPIESKKDLQNAIKAYGRSKDPKKTKAFIKKRAKELNAMDMIPENW